MNTPTKHATHAIARESRDEPSVFPVSWVIPALAVTTVLVVPLFVCMPLSSDTALFDVQARMAMNGGVLYRDIVEPNLPGIVWIHMALRSIVGWSSEAIRAVDLLILLGILAILCRIVSNDRPCWLMVFTAAVFYATRNEWCHCQRDTWMLLPALLALLIRIRRSHERDDQSPLVSTVSTADYDHRVTSDTLVRSVAMPLLEGVLWGIAFWIKPHIAIPAVAVFGYSCLTNRVSGRRKLAEIGLVLAGGCLAALPGIVWLVTSGAWAPFWEMMTEWNPEYLAAGRQRQSIDRWWMMAVRFHPWWIVHIVAVPLAAKNVMQRFQNKTSANNANILPSTELLGVLYLSWTAQSLLLQHAMDYIHVPAILLGIAVVTASPWTLPVEFRRIAAGSLLLVGVAVVPTFRPGYLSNWNACLRHGSTSELRERLSHGNFPHWTDIAAVTGFLSKHDASDKDLTCMNVHSVHLFRELGISPATRYWSVGILHELFPSHRSEIQDTVRNQHGRFIVVENDESELAERCAALDDILNGMTTVFQSGTYRVLAERDDTVATSITARTKTQGRLN